MCVSITTKVGDLIHEDMKFTFCRGRPYRNMPCHPCRHQNHFRHPACFGFVVFPRQKLETRLHVNAVLFIWFDLRLLCSSQVWHDLRWPFFFGQVVLRLSFFFCSKVLRLLERITGNDCWTCWWICGLPNGLTKRAHLLPRACDRFHNIKSRVITHKGENRNCKEKINKKSFYTNR